MIVKIPEFEEYMATHEPHYYRSWSKDEEAILEEYYGLIPPGVIAKKLGRTKKAIQDKADAMGLSAKENQKKFKEVPTDDSDESLDY